MLLNCRQKTEAGIRAEARVNSPPTTAGRANVTLPMWRLRLTTVRVRACAGVHIHGKRLAEKNVQILRR
ncbi:Uncharacterised protein [Mycobacteroides abscessus]|nr:Uncharacterised protein [Mycobacteroides abscessus]